MVAVDETGIELTDAQETILAKLLHMYNNGGGSPVKGKNIADAIDRNPGTIRTQMQSLKSLQLVNGIPGPKGGYEPTEKAYEIIDLERSDEFTPVPLSREGNALDETIATEVDLLNLHHPDRREAEIYVQGSVRQLRQDDTVKIGPTPASGLVVEGDVDGINPTESICVISINDMHFEETNI
ncbi:MAG: TrmB family transcriptional regulator [Halobacteriaceae archaeon]